jgi:hypothetical protein
MALDAHTSALVVAAVFNDAKCREIIPTQSVSSTPSTWRGFHRNFDYNVFGGKHPDTDEYTQDRVCYGIAAHTAMAIGDQVRNRKAGEVRTAGITRERSRFGFRHTATLVKMKDGSEYVFDWHATLDILNPLLYRSEDHWARDQGGVFYMDFQSWA